MKLFEYTILIAANPTVVFPVIADPRSKLAWVPAIRRVELESHGPPGLGTKYLASSGAGPFEFIFHERVVEWVEGERVAYEGRFPGGISRHPLNSNRMRLARLCTIAWIMRSPAAGSARCSES